uniref:C3H1-type domain-containing protein n=1 Tax=Neobodo designis TaxID=312471 RepID=A0A7S1KWY2_NEODS|mmetsp:Transcript_10305/g.31865  ORF Transcript_10305/g.31865 Transcript_10305/m.31865 type:complete len:301 (+) Transcript_10305:48-950(+)|eukprot:CAMPEP_0174840804 /NCGR_PEP_ID=MMETSP1114-20130205/8916_1 /TAXON_ID=312471 /ORGANISM="Neobodo designis, Strain CCAP 1951/1" /LENGTH=300 /DNA_ID=CAMNT_0016074971 /DNA_START=47 /DNA_END=949 /DNA_ORIENTATION=+
MPGPRDRAARVANYVTAEDEDDPNICSACLGPSTHVRMIRVPKGKACHSCERPYAAFSWRAAGDARPRFTLICKGCSTDKNACQSCMHDLATGLSMERRAQMSAEEIAALLERKRSRTTEEEVAALAANESQMQRRFQQKPCSFFAKGHCSRGAACPYRHVMPGRTETDVPATSANAAASIKARFAAAPTAAARDADEKAEEAKKTAGDRLLLEMAAAAPAVTSTAAGTAALAAAAAQSSSISSAAPQTAISQAPSAITPSASADKKSAAAPAPASEPEADEPDTSGGGGGFDFGFMDEE